MVRPAGAIIIGGYVNALGLVRALAARGVPTAVITTRPYDIAQHSRWISACAALPEIEEQPERLVELLAQGASTWSGWALIPTNDGALAALARYHEELSSTYCVIAPPPEVALGFLDKERMMDVARAVGVDVPHCYGPADAATAARSDLQFPVVVKPVLGYRFFTRFHCKLFAARDAPELRRCIGRLADAALRGDVFDLVPGPDSQIYAYCTYVDATGEPQPGITVRKLRQGPPFFGVARVAEIAGDQPVLRDATVEILRRLGFRGFAAAEFKLDPRDGRWRFLEVNGRSVVYNGLLRRAGLDVAGLAWSDYAWGQAEAVRANGWSGVWINLHADALYSLLHRADQPLTIAEFLAPYRRPKIEAVWSAGDPLPFLTQWSRTACAGAGAVWRGTYRALLAERRRVVPGDDRQAGNVV